VPRKIRILSIIDGLVFGGDENRLLTLATSLDRTKFELTVVTLRHENPKRDAYYGSMRQQYAAAGIHVRSLNMGHPNHGLAAGSVLRQLRRVLMFWQTFWSVCAIVRKERIDIVDGHTGPGNLIAVAAGIACGKRRIITTYNIEAWEPRWLWRAVHRATLRHADAIVTDSEAVAQVTRDFMLRGPHVHVIPNGVVPPKSKKTRAEMLRFFDLPASSDVRVVGQISSLQAYKGHMVLIEAARLVIDKQPNAAFLLVGFSRSDATYRERLEARARELGIADRVRIAAYPGPIGDVWQAIDIQAHPTLLDSLPNCLIEGMSLGKPAVSTDVGGIATLIDDDRTGLVVAPGSIEGLASALLRLLNNEAYANALGSAARDRYENGYTPQHMTGRLETLFTEIAA
jgi:glycosyltransferase involved in cell wall biosynthesis